MTSPFDIALGLAMPDMSYWIGEDVTVSGVVCKASVDLMPIDTMDADSGGRDQIQMGRLTVYDATGLDPANGDTATIRGNVFTITGVNDRTDSGFWEINVRRLVRVEASRPGYRIGS